MLRRQSRSYQYRTALHSTTIAKRVRQKLKPFSPTLGIVLVSLALAACIDCQPTEPSSWTLDSITATVFAERISPDSVRVDCTWQFFMAGNSLSTDVGTVRLGQDQLARRVYDRNVIYQTASPPPFSSRMSITVIPLEAIGTGTHQIDFEIPPVPTLLEPRSSDTANITRPLSVRWAPPAVTDVITLAVQQQLSTGLHLFPDIGYAELSPSDLQWLSPGSANISVNRGGFQRRQRTVQDPPITLQMHTLARSTIIVR
jgi:hypothetical protein